MHVHLIDCQRRNLAEADFDAVADYIKSKGQNPADYTAMVLPRPMRYVKEMPIGVIDVVPMNFPLIIATSKLCDKREIGKYNWPDSGWDTHIIFIPTALYQNHVLARGFDDKYGNPDWFLSSKGYQPKGDELIVYLSGFRLGHPDRYDPQYHKDYNRGAARAFECGRCKYGIKHTPAYCTKWAKYDAEQKGMGQDANETA